MGKFRIEGIGLEDIEDGSKEKYKESTREKN